ncbi:MAG: uroporphyrinogen-III synthase [Magnetococcus sp. WYHC-3]
MMAGVLHERVILVTRPEGEATAQAVRHLGGIPLLAPVLEMAPPDDQGPLHEALRLLDHYDAVVVTSLQGARVLRDLWPLVPFPAQDRRLFAVGQRTAAPLRQAGHQVQVPPQAGDARDLARWMVTAWPGLQRVLFLRAAEGREELEEGLRAAGVEVERVAAYQARPVASLPAPALAALRQREVHGIPLFSGRSAEVFFDLADRDAPGWRPGVLLAALSPVTAQAMAQRGYPADRVAPHPEMQALLRVLI